MNRLDLEWSVLMLFIGVVSGAAVGIAGISPYIAGPILLVCITWYVMGFGDDESDKGDS